MIRKFYDMIVDPDGSGSGLVPYVPYQLCPKCHGEGIINSGGAFTAPFKQCDVCGGAKIIPMFPIEQKDKQSVATGDAMKPEP